MAKRNKTEGLGIMISILISREFGWTFGLKDKELARVLKKVNENHNKQHYVNTKAANAVHNSTLKPKLTETPFF